MSRIISNAILTSLLLGVLPPPAAGAGKQVKYYFKVIDVKLPSSADSSLGPVARELLQKELESRPEFTSDLGAAKDEQAVIEEIKKRGLRGFGVTLNLDKFLRETRAPRPGGRLKQLALDVKLTVLGATLPGEKMAFSGDGEAMQEAEVVERRMEEEAATMTRDVLGAALKQAIDQAILKLTIKPSTPMNEKRKKARR